MNTNIVLTGLMGAGKSTIGKMLSKVLKNYTFVDIDDVIVDLEGMSIPQIFEKKSEKYFREIETQVIEELSQEENLIIALGGGAFECEENRINLAENGKVFYLQSSVESLFNRIKDDSNRPLLKCDDPKAKLAELLEKREHNYLKADFTINTDNKNVDEILNEIISFIEE